jgi:hypothetical protein
MCGDYYSTSPEDADDYRNDNPEYKYVKFTTAVGAVAYLIEDEEDTNASTRFNAVDADGDTSGWDTKDNAITYLTDQGFSEEQEEPAGEPVNA